MKLNLPALLMVLGGTLLVYSAYVDDDPRNVIFSSLGINRRVPHTKAGGGSAGAKSALPGTAGDVTVPDQGYSNSPHDAWGRPLGYSTGAKTLTV